MLKIHSLSLLSCLIVTTVSVLGYTSRSYSQTYSYEEQSSPQQRLSPNSFHRPGGNKFGAFYIAPLVSYNEYDAFFGVAASVPLGPFSVSPYYIHGTKAGPYIGGLFRHPFYESESRDINIEWFASFATEKSLLYRERITGTEVEVLEESQALGGGLGATKRWMSNLGISAQFHVIRSGITDEFRTLSTLYGFVGISSNYAVFAGVVNDDPMVGLELGFARLGYNFSSEAMEIGISAVVF